MADATNLTIVLQYQSPDGKSGGDTLTISGPADWVVGIETDRIKIDRIFPPLEGWRRLMARQDESGWVWTDHTYLD